MKLKLTHDEWDLIRNVSLVVGIHLLGAYIVTRYLTTNTQAKTLVGTIFILMLILYFLLAEKKTIRILKNLLSYTKKQFTQKKNIMRIIIHVIHGCILSAVLFGLLKIGVYVGWYIIPQEHLHSISIMYFLISVPVQQLLFFILPERISEGKLNPLILSAIAIPFFGTVHGYYPDFMTVVLTGVALGIPSAYLVFYKKNYYAAIFVHMIAGAVALTVGLV